VAVTAIPQVRMDHYWDQLLQNMLCSPSTSKSKLKFWLNSVQDEGNVDSEVTEKVEEEKKDSPKIKKSRKKSKKRDETNIPIQGMKNLSITSDEGIDISFSPLNSTSVTSIPKAIMRPQHHLQSSWTFWYSVGDKGLSWEQNQIKICTVSTIEQFWYVTSQLQPPSNIKTGHTYSVFRAGILPDWEDKANIRGGRWMISCLKKEREEKLDKWWLEILIMMIGEHMDEFSGLVNGAEACMRKKGDRIEVWLKDVGLMKGVVEIGRKTKEKVGLDVNRKIKFSLHKEDKEGVKGPRLGL